MLILNLSFGEEHILAREFTYSLRTALFKYYFRLYLKVDVCPCTDYTEFYRIFKFKLPAKSIESCSELKPHLFHSHASTLLATFYFCENYELHISRALYTHQNYN